MRNGAQKDCREIQNTHFVLILYPEYRAVWEIMWKKWQCQTGQRWQYNTAQAFCMLDKEGYRHTLRICNTYCFSTVTMVYSIPRHCYVVRTLALVDVWCSFPPLSRHSQIYLLSLKVRFVTWQLTPALYQ